MMILLKAVHNLNFMAQHPCKVRTQMTVLRNKSKQTIDNRIELKRERSGIAHRSTQSQKWCKVRVSGTKNTERESRSITLRISVTDYEERTLANYPE